MGVLFFVDFFIFQSEFIVDFIYKLWYDLFIPDKEVAFRDKSYQEDHIVTF